MGHDADESVVVYRGDRRSLLGAYKKETSDVHSGFAECTEFRAGPSGLFRLRGALKMKENVEEWRKKDVERALGIKFKDSRLLLQAFTRDSYLNEHKDSGLKSYQRLEFLGDAVIGLMSADYFFHRYDGPEEQLTTLREKVVSMEGLAKAARRIGLGDYLLVSHGEVLTEGMENSTVLEDCFEAVAGAMFLDRGYKETMNFLVKNLFEV